MNRSDWLTDELIQAAFERRAGRAAPGDLRETILTLSAASSQRLPWHLQVRNTMSTLVLSPVMLKGVAAATVIGVIVVGGALFVMRPDQPVVGEPSPTPNETSSPSTPASPSAGPSAAVAPRAAAWTATGKMIMPRTGHTATLLLDGRVLVVGGGAAVAGANDRTSAELYDPGTGRWASTGSMATPRIDFSATLLADGKVLVAGGSGNTGTPTSAELYNPVTGTWSPTGSMVAPSESRTAVRLLDGTVLVAGNNGAVASAELYDPISGTWTATGNMVSGTGGAGATLLRDGKVLVVGTSGPSELYDPISRAWNATGNMITPTCACTATLLPDGNVLVAGGTKRLGGTDLLATAELYDPQTGAWSATQGMVVARVGHAAVLLPDGKVLVTGGTGSEKPGAGAPWLTSAELYDPGTGTWASTASMATPRGYGLSATLLADGKVLVAGGMGIVPMPGGTGSAVVASAELYDPGSGN
jgi:hypothetical protein